MSLFSLYFGENPREKQIRLTGNDGKYWSWSKNVLFHFTHGRASKNVVDSIRIAKQNKFRFSDRVTIQFQADIKPKIPPLYVDNFWCYY